MKDKINIVGAGLVGSLLALHLKQRGFEVTLFEKRKDPRLASTEEGRSINLALSYRGIKSLKAAGIFDSRIVPYLTPVRGRMMHDTNNKEWVQLYSNNNLCINSIPRSELNRLLIEETEKAGVKILFEHICQSIDFETNRIYFQNGSSYSADLIIAADGAFSAIRSKMQLGYFNYCQKYIEHGYKELRIPSQSGKFRLSPNYLHIWPRKHFMLIALPNHDKTFTATLFLPFKGNISFELLRSSSDVIEFFKKYFPDILMSIPDLTTQFFQNPTSSLVTISCDPWHIKNTLLIGDSAHAIVPFFGQGMNSGFEDITWLLNLAEKLDYRWEKVLPLFAATRKKETDIISRLALDNFIEMRDHVSDPMFLKRKKIEKILNERYPKIWTSLYMMVTFTDIPYSKAYYIGNIQKKVLDEFLYVPEENINYSQIIQRFKERLEKQNILFNQNNELTY